MQMVVIGGTAAGLSAAAKARRLDREMEINVFEATSYVSYGSCGLPYFVGGCIAQPEELVSLTVEELREKRGIAAHTRHRVLAIDREGKAVKVLALDSGRESWQRYDRLVLATGASPVMPPIPGADGPGVCTLRTVEDGIRLKQLAGKAKHVVVIGGGFIGVGGGAGGGPTPAASRLPGEICRDGRRGTGPPGGCFAHRRKGGGYPPGRKKTSHWPPAGGWAAASGGTGGGGGGGPAQYPAGQGLRLGPGVHRRHPGGRTAADHRPGDLGLWRLCGDAPSADPKALLVPLGHHRQQAGSCGGGERSRGTGPVPRGSGVPGHQGVRPLPCRHRSRPGTGPFPGF